MIISVEGNIAKVGIEKKQSCIDCPSASFCRPGGDSSNVMEAFNEIGANPGQRVRIEFIKGSIVAGSFFLYMFPVIMLVVFSGIAQFVTKKEIFSIICGFFGLVLSFMIIWLGDKKIKKFKLIPRVKEIL